MSLELLLRLGGALMVANGIGHVILPHVLGWPKELAAVSRLTRHVSYAHVYFIGLMCVTWGFLAILAAPDLADPKGTLAEYVLVGITIFCASRLVVQFLVDPVLWRSWRFGTMAFAGSALWWLGETLVFIWPLLA